MSHSDPIDPQCANPLNTHCFSVQSGSFEDRPVSVYTHPTTPHASNSTIERILEFLTKRFSGADNTQLCTQNHQSVSPDL
jgi:hypothetical protein